MGKDYHHYHCQHTSFLKSTHFTYFNFKSFIKLTIFTIFLSNLTVLAQWEPDVRLTFDPAISFTSPNNSWAIGHTQNFLHIIWRDDRPGSFEVYHKRSSDGGTNWTSDTRLTVNASQKESPSVATTPQFLHVVWTDWRDGNREIYFKRSSDEGTSWGIDTRLTNNSAISRYPSIAVSGQIIHVVWEDTRDAGNYEIYYKRSTDGGINWEPDVRLTDMGNDSFTPSIAVSGQNVHVVWYDNRSGNYKIFYKRSTDQGATWESDVMLTTNSANAFEPSISANGQNIHVAWEDYRHNGDSEIYYKFSSDGGTSWGTDTRLTNSPDWSQDPSIAATGENVHIAWWDRRDGNTEIYYKQSTNEGISFAADTRLTNSSSGSENPTICISGTFVNIAWYDFRDGNAEVYFKRNPTGNLTGISTINSEIPNSYGLSQNYPNPFNPSTKIQFAVPKQSKISLKILDVTGRIAASVIENLEMNPGNYEEDFNSENLSSGVYFYSLYADGILIETKKMVLLK